MTSAEKPTPAVPPDEELVYIVQSNFIFRDHDDKPVVNSEPRDDLGWFADRETAQAAVDDLNAANIEYWHSENDRLRRVHEARVAEIEQKNREAAAIRAAGMEKKDLPLPKDFEPQDFETFIAGRSHNTHEVVTLSRSEKDLFEAKRKNAEAFTAARAEG